MSELPPAGDTPAHAAETSAPSPAPETPRKITAKALSRILRSNTLTVKFGGESRVEISPKALGDALVHKIGVKPAKVAEFLSRNTKFLIIPAHGKFLYFKTGTLIRVSDAKGGVYAFPDDFPLLHEGIVILPDEERTAVWVTIDDLRRNEFSKYRTLKLKRGKISYDDFVNGTFGKTAAAIAREQRGANGASSGDSSAADGDPRDQDPAGSFDDLTDEELQAALHAAGSEEFGVPGSFDSEA